MGNAKRTDEIQGEILHVYDGIEEADNRLPRWWMWSFYATIVFAIGYWFAYHEFTAGTLPGDRYLAERTARAAGGSEVTEELLLTHAADDDMVEAGRSTFASNCAPCHGVQGEGTIGPNLTDDHWIRGGSPMDIFNVIRDGSTAKGMPAWGPSLGSVSVQQLTAYVLNIRGTNVPGKEPEGEPWPGDS